MTATSCHCQLCGNALEPVQQFRYLVEAANEHGPAVREGLRKLPTVNGRPLRVCKGCDRRVAADPAGFRAAVSDAKLKAARGYKQYRTGLMTAFGVLSVGWFLTSLVGSPRV